MMTTTSFPAFSGRRATSKAAQTAAPEEIPAKMPSSRASLRAVAPASSSFTTMISSINSVFKTGGMKPAPMPWILCGPGRPPERTGLAAGSTATTRNPGRRGLITSATPVRVPPVPTPATRKSIRPPVSLQISSAVVSRWARGLAGLENCWSNR